MDEKTAAQKALDHLEGAAKALRDVAGARELTEIERYGVIQRLGELADLAEGKRPSQS